MASTAPGRTDRMASPDPEPDRTTSRGPPGPAGLRGLDAFRDAGGDARVPGVRDVVALLAEHAPGLFPLVLSDPGLPADVVARPLGHDEERGALRRRFLEATASLGDGATLQRTLRRLRHRALVRIALREVLRLADVDQTSAEMAELADAAIDAALAACRRTAVARFGEARTADGRAVPLVVLGMGKLGGRELNLGSDVDLCFFYGTDDAVVGDGQRTTVHELFARVAARTTRALAEPTEDGFVFRVDLRLRPEGTRGPLVNSLASAERYYETFGQTWERAALLRARPVAGDLAFGAHLLAVLEPFVYRREVRPSIAVSMAELVERARREHAAHEDDVKLGRGGIREAEFFVQTLQLVWGGRHRELRVQNTIEAARRLRSSGLVSDRELAALEGAWALLRRVEHRIHATAGYQTHVVPVDRAARESFARSLGFADAAGFERALADARGDVAALFDSLRPERADDPELATLGALADRAAGGAGGEELAPELAAPLNVAFPDEAAAHLARVARRGESPFGPAGRARHPALAPRLLAEVRDAADPDQALAMLAEFFARLGGAWGYDRLLANDPRLARRLVALFGASATLAASLVRHPESVDAVLSGGGVAPSPDAVRAAHAELPRASGGDPERFVGELRRRKREVTLHAGLGYTSGELSLPDVEALLTALAEAQIEAALAFARGGAEEPAAREAPLAVVGLGKLGAGELGFGSDLDLTFVYDGAAHDDLAHHTRVAQRTMRLLSQPDVEGEGYETDIRLRPGGSQGLLVVSLAAFDRYHATRAAAWERQALLRARVLVAPPPLREALEARFVELAYGRGAPAAEALAELRRRIELELAGERPAARLHPKLGHGGIVDVEFLVQWLQMRHGDDATVVTRRTLDAIARLEAIGALGPEEALALRQAHGWLRRVEQALRLVDPSSDGRLLLGSRGASKVARFLGLRERDGVRPDAVLLETWARHARAVRSLFEARLAPVGTPAPFV